MGRLLSAQRVRFADCHVAPTSIHLVHLGVTLAPGFSARFDQAWLGSVPSPLLRTLFTLRIGPARRKGGRCRHVFDASGECAAASLEPVVTVTTTRPELNAASSRKRHMALSNRDLISGPSVRQLQSAIMAMMVMSVSADGRTRTSSMPCTDMNCLHSGRDSNRSRADTRF